MLVRDHQIRRRLPNAITVARLVLSGIFFGMLLAYRHGNQENAWWLFAAGWVFGLPDLAMTTLNDVCEDIRRITYATSLPLLVDADTGWGGAFMIGRTVREMHRAGAAACHIEDQVSTKRCGHRPGKALVDAAEMVDRMWDTMAHEIPRPLEHALGDNPRAARRLR